MSEALDRALELLLNGKVNQVKAMLAQQEYFGEGYLGAGRRLAIEGLASTLNHRRGEKHLPDPQKMIRMRRVLEDRLKSIWCDDLERGYIQVWLRFLSSYLSRSLGKMHEGVVEYPGEEEEHYEAPQP